MLWDSICDVEQRDICANVAERDIHIYTKRTAEPCYDTDSPLKCKLSEILWSSNVVWS